MGYWLDIGKAHVSYSSATGDTFPAELRPEVKPAHQDVDNPSDVHYDRFDRASSAHRSISYHSWKDTLEAIPAMNELMEELYEYATRDEREFIPVEVYEDRLDALEEAAKEHLTDAEGDREHAQGQRVLWFVHWSRKARELYGDHAAFGTPGEWV